MKKLLALFLGLTMTMALASGLEKINPLEAEKMQKEKKAIIVDVREPNEIKEGMAKEAISVPLSTMKDKKKDWEKIVNTFPKDKTVIVYCGIGVRAEKVGLELAKKGYKVLNMGGFESWEKAGLPLVKK
ncbi:MAG: rhodanese-like domain-containing protein [Bacteriovorax sp.]|nr:rhodanese-like domain-containing protein [Bacteriovorax sp.]